MIRYLQIDGMFHPALFKDGFRDSQAFRVTDSNDFRPHALMTFALMM
jgi:hypothetical protein